VAPTTGRRRFLERAIAGAALLAIGGAVAWLRTRGYDVPKERAEKLAVLAPWQLVVVEHAARRICASDGGKPAPPSADEVDVAGFVDAYIARLPEATRTDLLRLLGYLEHLAPAAVGYSSRFTKLAPADQDRVLGGLEASSKDLLRAGFAGLKAAVFMGYYRDPRAWAVAGYEGPWLKR
jgi:hypothetical protein